MNLAWQTCSIISCYWKMIVRIASSMRRHMRAHTKWQQQGPEAWWWRVLAGSVPQPLWCQDKKSAEVVWWPCWSHWCVLSCIEELFIFVAYSILNWCQNKLVLKKHLKMKCLKFRGVLVYSFSLIATAYVNMFLIMCFRLFVFNQESEFFLVLLTVGHRKTRYKYLQWS